MRELFRLGKASADFVEGWRMSQLFQKLRTASADNCFVQQGPEGAVMVADPEYFDYCVHRNSMTRVVEMAANFNFTARVTRDKGSYIFVRFTKILMS